MFALENSNGLLIQLFHGRVVSKLRRGEREGWQKKKINLEEIHHSIIQETFFDFCLFFILVMIFFKKLYKKIYYKTV